MEKFKQFAFVGIIYAFFVVPTFGQSTNETGNPSVIPKENWKMFSSEKLRFSICLPGLPEQTNFVVKAKLGNVTISRVIVCPDWETEYSVNFTDYRSSPTNLTSHQILEMTGDALKRSAWKIEFEKNISINGYPGKEFGFEVGGKSRVSGFIKLFCVKGFLYEVQIIFHRDNPHRDDFEKFFNSFSLQDELEK
ncbi:MAG TPA: hypothetical protein VK742_08815 [Candidatus Sulfotelmatobacter sp.]|jgi:hypothetical protein|nr:hypothetical protein [Candidatus Sulfotelmatobacter sp.]